MEMLLSQEYSLWRCLYLRDIVCGSACISGTYMWFVEVLVSHGCSLWRCMLLRDIVCGSHCTVCGGQHINYILCNGQCHIQQVVCGGQHKFVEVNVTYGG